MSKKVTFAAFRLPQYRWVWGSGLMGALGAMTYGMAQGWLLLDITGSPAWVGLAPALTGITSVSLSPLVGVLADRLDRRLLLMAGQLVMGSCLMALALLVLTDLVQVWHVLAAAVGQGVMRATQPARSSLTFDIVGRSGIQSAMAAQFAAGSIAATIGPMTGGLILDAAGAAPLLFVMSGLSAVAVAFLSRIRAPVRPPSPRASVLRNLKEGVDFAFSDRPTRAVLSVIGLTEVCGFAALSMLPVVARDVLHADARVLGLLTALWGVGGVLATGFLTFRGDIERKGWVFVGSALTLGAALLLFSFSRTLPLSLALLLVAGAAGSTYDTMGNTLLQTLAPDALRGRVAGLYSLLLSGGSLGGMWMGAVAELRGVTIAVAIGGSIVTVNALRHFPIVSMINRQSAERASAVATALVMLRKS